VAARTVGIISPHGDGLSVIANTLPEVRLQLDAQGMF
jgi:hypothetical protein